MKRVASIILNRNLPEPTERLYEYIYQNEKSLTDIYVVEAGSDNDRISKYCTWHVTEDEVMKKGLRYCRGMNYALLELIKDNKFEEYDAFFLLTNDTILCQRNTINKLLEIFDFHKNLGIISPCSKKWGEKYLLEEEKTKYFWFIHNNALMLRREFIEKIATKRNPNYFNYVFDGNNFRGFLSESELIAKAYANNWAAGVTTNVFAEENEAYLLNNSDLIKTETYQENLKLYIDEGLEWIRDKYGFNSHWRMHQYVKFFYDNFFEYNPEYLKYKI
tara:strand:- start:162 stop:986 length:825 start_codon:yes stop_codon:yes gene_type:complete